MIVFVTLQIRILSNSESLLDYLPKGCLPSDYGGTDLPLSEQKTKWTKLLIENKEFLERIGRAKPSGPIPKSLASTETEFGVDGSFRQLNID